jgi:DNA-binding transcriptional ArsR family regulator
MSIKGKMLKSILGNDSYWSINKTLAKKLGLEETVLLQHMIDITAYKNMGDEFYQQMNRLSKELGLSERKISNHIDKLKNMGLISVTKKGIPAKNYYTLNSDNILDIFNGEDDEDDEEGIPVKITGLAT